MYHFCSPYLKNETPLILPYRGLCLDCDDCLLGSPENCPFAIDGICPGTPVGPNGALPGTAGARWNPEADPKLDGTGGWGKPANPDGPQDGSAPGQGYRGGRG